MCETMQIAVNSVINWRNCCVPSLCVSYC